MAVKSNYEHLMTLGLRRMASVIWKLCDDYCAFCPRNITRSCNYDCASGIREWLMAPYIPGSEIWKERKE